VSLAKASQNQFYITYLGLSFRSRLAGKIHICDCDCNCNHEKSKRTPAVGYWPRL